MVTLNLPESPPPVKFCPSIYPLDDLQYVLNRFSLSEIRQELHVSEVNLSAASNFGVEGEANEWQCLVDLFQEAFDECLDEQATQYLQTTRGQLLGVRAGDVKARTNVVDYIGQYVQLKKQGTLFVGLCPFHDEKHGSFFVYPKTQTWHCFGACGIGGDIISFAMKYHNLDFKGALEVLGGR